MNALPTSIEKGTFGEIYVQLRLLQYGVQSAPPIKDSGNDLIAIRRNIFNAIQVKTTTTGFPMEFNKAELPDLYHILALVVLKNFESDEGTPNFTVTLDDAKVFLIRHDNVTKGYWIEEELLPFEMNVDRINELFPL